jgi:processive 1,2-diacylglycerol beta-glucosyltransferase
LLLGKPGGLTTCEALAKNLPIVIVRPIRGQEERNSDHLLEEDVAIRCNNLPVLAYKIDSLLDNPKRLALMRKNAKRLARPLAAIQIVKKTPRPPQSLNSIFHLETNFPGKNVFKIYQPNKK